MPLDIDTLAKSGKCSTLEIWVFPIRNIHINTYPHVDSLYVETPKHLSQLSTYISTSEQEIGYAVDFTKPYAEIRSAYLSKSLHPLAQAVQVSERHQGSSYEKGSSEFLKYMDCFAKMAQVRFAAEGKMIKISLKRVTLGRAGLCC